RNGRLLDVDLLFKTVRAVGDPFWLRGVEGTIEGDLVQAGGRPALKIAGSGEVLPLAPLAHKVQWDTKQNREQASTETERRAYERLTASKPPPGSRVRIVGPLERNSDGQPPVLEVRQFSWLSQKPARVAAGARP